MHHDSRLTYGRQSSAAVNAIACFEGKAAANVEQELGDLIRMAPATIQRYKTGWVPDDPAIVEALAEAAVKRAFLARPWLQRFLHAARYYDAPALLERLVGPEEARPPSPPICHNLPAPTYGQFVMRPEPFQAVVEGLGQRTAVVAVISLGGMGKTSLALEVATRCLRQTRPAEQTFGHETPRFDAAVWISDKDRPGRTTLAAVLDELAQTLGYPGLTQFEPGRKQREVELLLKQQRVLLIVDNLETIGDDSLLHWLLRLPEPSKALITTREYRREFQQGAWLVELKGMAEAEAGQFIVARARQIALKLVPDIEAQRQLIALTGGNPKAIELVLGLVKRSGQPATQLALFAPRARGGQHKPFDTAAERHGAPGDLLADLFVASWETLSQEARQILLATTLFPTSVARTVLMTVAGIGEAAFFQAVQQLADLTLLDIEHPSAQGGDQASEARYTLHPLTRRFVEAKAGAYAGFLAATRERCLDWAVAYVAEFGYLLDDISRLQRLDADEPALASVLAWASGQGRFAETIQLVKGLEFYYYVRARWNKKLDLHEKYIVAAEQLGDRREQVLALTMHIQLLSRQGKPRQAEPFLRRLHTLTRSYPLGGALAFHVQHAQGLYALAAGDLGPAQQAWQCILHNSEAWELADHMTIGARHWLGVCLYQQRRFEEARSCFQTALDQARARGYGRVVARNQLLLALIDLESGEIERAQQRLLESQAQTEPLDWEQQARLQWALARLYEQQGNYRAAEEAQRLAADLLKRTGIADYDRQLVA